MPSVDPRPHYFARPMTFVFPGCSVAFVSSVAVWSSHLPTNRISFYFFQSKCVVIVSSPLDLPTKGGL